jgi:hypothetical protein
MQPYSQQVDDLERQDSQASVIVPREYREFQQVRRSALQEVVSVIMCELVCVIVLIGLNVIITSIPVT